MVNRKDKGKSANKDSLIVYGRGKTNKIQQIRAMKKTKPKE